MHAFMFIGWVPIKKGGKLYDIEALILTSCGFAV